MAKLTRISPGRWKGRFKFTSGKGAKKLKTDTERNLPEVSIEGGLREERKRAEKAYDKLEHELKGGGEEWTVEEAVEPWLATLPQGTERTRRTHARSFADEFGPLKLSQVLPSDIQGWLVKLPCTDETANSYRAGISAMYKFARGQGKLIGKNVIKETVRRETPLTSAQKRERALAERKKPRKALLGDERWRFFDMLEKMYPELYPLLRCQFIVGGRVGELIALQIPDIDWETGHGLVWQNAVRNGELNLTKSGEPRHVFFGVEGLEFLRGHRARMEQLQWPGWETWVFPRPPYSKRGREPQRKHDMWIYDSVRRYTRDVLDACGIQLSCVTHSMRHTHVTIDQALRADAIDRQTQNEELRDLQDRIGHKSKDITEGYTDDSVRRERQRAAALRLEPHIFGRGVTPIRPLKSGVKSGEDSAETPENKA